MLRAHRVVGVLFVIVFVATGVYMRLGFPDLHMNDPVMRMSFRSAHVYILLTAMINLLLGVHLRPPAGTSARRLQSAGSMCLLATPGLMTAAFFVEPGPGLLLRPIVLPALIVAIVGCALHLVAARRPPRYNMPRSDPEGAGPLRPTGL